MTCSAYILPLVSGVLGEVFLFSRGEWDRHAPQVMKAFTFASAGSIVLFWKGFGLPIVASIRETALHGTALLAGLFGSMIAYRLFFHPLRSFPGPVAARISSFWVIKQSAPDLRFYVKLRELHAHYGDFVRIRKQPDDW